MLAVKVTEDLWATTMAPLGELERWRARDGERVDAGQAVAEVRIEDALHEIVSPGQGLLATEMQPGDVVEPDSLLGWVKPAAHN